MHFRAHWRWLGFAIALAVFLLAVGASLSVPRTYILMATTTSTRDTGLLPYLLPKFTAESGIDVRYIAVGTGQALDAGRRGDVDVVMVHSPAQEQAFMDAGDGLCRNSLMYNRFVLIGPDADPADVHGATSALDAFRRIYDASQADPGRPLFESRGDNSGTHAKELALWAAAGLNASAFGGWYERTSQGMGATLTIANQRATYTLSDDGTWYALESSLGFLRLTYASNETILRNQYSIIPVNPSTHPGLHTDAALVFARWLAGSRGQTLIGAYAVNGHQIFTPDATETC